MNRMSTKTTIAIIAAGVMGGIIALGINRLASPEKPSITLMRGDSVVSSAGTKIAGPSDFREAAKRILPSVVSIDAVGAQNGFWGMQQVSGSGSGIVFSNDGLIITNAHVVTAGDETQQVMVHLEDGRSFEAKIQGVDQRSDLAVLKIDAPNLQPALFGKSSALEVGEWVIAVGNPLGQDHTLSVGVVSNLGRDLPTNKDGILINAIQTDAAINPGNSGGALTNSQGEVVGINSAILSTRDTGSIGIGFAIPVDRALPIIDDLIKYGRARYGYLGIDLYQYPGVMQNERFRFQYERQFGIKPPESGVLIYQVEAGSPAARAGIKGFDVLLELNGKKLNERLDFLTVMAQAKPGTKLKMTYWSQGQTYDREVLLTEAEEI